MNDAPAYQVRENAISHKIIGCAYEVQRSLGGPGLLESIYEQAFAWEMRQAGLHVDRQVELPVKYKGISLDTKLRLDLLVENCVIVECKSVEAMHPIFRSQAMTYLRLTDLRLALVINFGMYVMKGGFYRVANGLPDEPKPVPNGNRR